MIKCLVKEKNKLDRIIKKFWKKDIIYFLERWKEITEITK